MFLCFLPPSNHFPLHLKRIECILPTAINKVLDLVDSIKPVTAFTIKIINIVANSFFVTLQYACTTISKKGKPAYTNKPAKKKRGKKLRRMMSMCDL